MPRTSGGAPGAVLVPRNYLHGCLLLLIGESPAHGYDLLARLGELGIANIDSAAVYRALRILDDDGLLESWWEGSDCGPARRRYRLSHPGGLALETWATTVHTSATCLSSFLIRHRQLRGDPRLVGNPA